MPRILTVPVRLTEGVPLVQLSGLVAVDAARRWASDPDEPVELRVTTLSGGVAVHHEVERILVREGLDRETIGSDVFAERVAAFEARGLDRLRAVAALLGADADLVAAPLDDPAVCAAAATAFVRLYDAGIVRRDERVVPTCPRCATPLSDVDVVADAVTTDVVVLSLGDDLEVRTAEPELLVGVVAVAVPAGHPADGTDVDVPLAGPVPVVGDDGVTAPRLVVPAHDAEAFTLARRLNLRVEPVVDDEGVVLVEGPLAGFARHAARAAALDLLAASPSARVEADAEHPLRRCAACATAIVDRLGRHWFVDVAPAAGAAADGIREGGVTFAPPVARDAFLQAAAEVDESWCLSLRLPTGCPMPIACCVECGEASVGVDPGDTCGKCLGPLAPDPSVLDPRFVGAVATLAAAGWPGDEAGPARDAPVTTLVCGPDGIRRWVAPTFALAAALTGSVPVAAVVVHEGPADVDGGALVDVEELVASASLGAVRLAVLAGDLDVAAAEQLATRLDDPPAGDADVDDLAAAVEAAFAGANLSTVVGLLAAAADTGVAAPDRDRFRRLGAPVLGRR